MRKEIVMSSRIGRPSSATTAHGTKAGGFVFVTGQVANKPGTDPLKRPAEVGEMGGIEEQTTQVLENIKAILEEAGTSFEHVVKRNIYITHLGDFDPVYRIMARYFSTRVASTGVVTGLVRVSARVEIVVIAVVPERGP
jgi:2-iminobutanoate/2-iminopropanoate deaminase